MTNPNRIQEIRRLLQSGFRHISEPNLIDEIIRDAELIEVEAGKPILEVGSPITVIPLALDGIVKVSRVDEAGHEIFLYYIEVGQTCVMTLSACLHEEHSLVRATAETDSLILAIPSHRVSYWQSQYTSWRNFITLSYDARFQEVMRTIDAIAFQKLDERLVQLLQTKSRVLETSNLRISHQNLADELHATREVISRLLKQLEKDGKLRLFRNRIELLEMSL